MLLHLTRSELIAWYWLLRPYAYTASTPFLKWFHHKFSLRLFSRLCSSLASDIAKIWMNSRHPFRIFIWYILLEIYRSEHRKSWPQPHKHFVHCQWRISARHIYNRCKCKRHIHRSNLTLTRQEWITTLPRNSDIDQHLMGIILKKELNKYETANTPIVIHMLPN